MSEVTWLPTASWAKAQGTVDGLQLSARSLPGRDIDDDRGDFFDLYPLRPGRLGIVVGDVSDMGDIRATTVQHWPVARKPGEGVARALAILRAMASIKARPSWVLAGLNQVSLAWPVPDPSVLNVTYAAVRPTRAGMLVRICTAGQQRPFVRRASGGVFALGKLGLPLGLHPDPRLHDVRLLLRPGDSLILVTDNVTHALGQDHTSFGAERLCQIVADSGGASAARTVGAILSEVRDFTGGDVAHDTVALVVKVPRQRAG
jgi:serine phosphatase RsbU (regulator of sigma subunit)